MSNKHQQEVDGDLSISPLPAQMNKKIYTCFSGELQANIQFPIFTQADKHIHHRFIVSDDTENKLNPEQISPILGHTGLRSWSVPGYELHPFLSPLPKLRDGAKLLNEYSSLEPTSTNYKLGHVWRNHHFFPLHKPCTLEWSWTD